MTHPVKKAATAFLISVFSITSIAAVSTFATADVVYAKSDKSKGGGGKGGGKGASKRGGGKSDKARGRGKEKSGSRHGGLDFLFGKGNGKEREKTKSASRGGAGKSSLGKSKRLDTTPTETVRAAARPEKEFKHGMHPRELGKMNGALNANENAILAHIRNGNHNGPVGLMAATALASHEKDIAAETLSTNLAAEYQAIDEFLEGTEYETYEDYLNAVEESEENRIGELDALVEAIGQADLEEELGEEFADYEDYLAQVESDESLRDENIEEAYAVSGGGYDPDYASKIEEAEAAEQAYEDALGDMLEAWNKGGAESDNADDLVDAIEARIASYEGVAEAAADAAESESNEGCDEEGSCVVDDDTSPEEDDVAEAD